MRTEKDFYEDDNNTRMWIDDSLEVVGNINEAK
jgi:hypothetical protein